jgi:tRNA dimethylallyltransferase
MLSAGLVDEVRGLLDRGISPDAPALSAIGYREIVPYLQGWQTLEQAVTEIKRDTRIFVRRQANWFKLTDPDIHWFRVGPATAGAVEALIRNWLAVLA